MPEEREGEDVSLFPLLESQGSDKRQLISGMMSTLSSPKADKTRAKESMQSVWTRVREEGGHDPAS